MCLKVFSWREKWTIKRADHHSSSGAGNVLYTTKNSYAFQCLPHLDVFWTSNSDKNARDFHAVSNCMGDTFEVYKGDAKIAEMNYRLHI
ncbi:hypothetical protein Sjap_014271 [Stephania japonica]|uniref:Uncharacterized protein n=1 Tax=Stephania japonica TaxID=461633 RepID=A0AAP0IZG6_9MAGN